MVVYAQVLVQALEMALMIQMMAAAAAAAVADFSVVMEAL